MAIVNDELQVKDVENLNLTYGTSGYFSNSVSANLCIINFGCVRTFREFSLTRFIV